MMLFIAMIEGIGTDTKSKKDHRYLEGGIMNDIHPEQGEAAKE